MLADNCDYFFINMKISKEIIPFLFMLKDIHIKRCNELQTDLTENEPQTNYTSQAIEAICVFVICFDARAHFVSSLS